MTEQQKDLIRQSWEVAVTVPNAMELFYNRLFEINPGAIKYFPKDMSKQMEKLAYMLGYVVNNLDRLEDLKPSLHDLGRVHRKHKIADSEYPSVGEALVWTIEQAMGSNYKPEIGEAWATAYGFLSNEMINAPVEREKKQGIGGLIARLFKKAS